MEYDMGKHNSIDINTIYTIFPLSFIVMVTNIYIEISEKIIKYFIWATFNYILMLRQLYLVRKARDLNK